MSCVDICFLSIYISVFWLIWASLLSPNLFSRWHPVLSNDTSCVVLYLCQITIKCTPLIIVRNWMNVVLGPLKSTITTCCLQSVELGSENSWGGCVNTSCCRAANSLDSQPLSVTRQRPNSSSRLILEETIAPGSLEVGHVEPAREEVQLDYRRGLSDLCLTYYYTSFKL